MNNFELQFLKLVETLDNYNKYKKYILTNIFIPEIKELLLNIEEYYSISKTPTLDWDKFRIWLRISKHAGKKQEKKEIYDRIVSNAETTVVTDELFTELNKLTTIGEVYEALSQGNLTLAHTLLKSYITETPDTTGKESDRKISIDADVVARSLYSTGGLSWSIPELEKSIGDLHTSDLCIIGKRPETGGTSFLCHQMTAMLSDMPEGKKAIIFHNEEGIHKIAGRLIQVTTGLTARQIHADPIEANKKFVSALKGREIDLYNAEGMSTADIDSVLASGEYYLIGINILEKVQSSTKGEEFERIGRLAKWAREVAKRHGVVFAIMQADGTAEDEPYLKQTQLYNSKTLVQQESDVQIMIGKDNDPANERTRYISIVRNKKPCTGSMDPAWKYAKFELDFDHETGIYKSKVF